MSVLDPSNTTQHNTGCSTDWKNESKWGFLGIGGRNKCTMEIQGDGQLTLTIVHQTWLRRMASRFMKNQASETKEIGKYKIERIDVLNQLTKNDNYIKTNIELIFKEFKTFGEFNNIASETNVEIKSLKNRVKSHTNSINNAINRKIKRLKETAKFSISHTSLPEQVNQPTVAEPTEILENTEEGKNDRKGEHRQQLDSPELTVDSNKGEKKTKLEQSQQSTLRRGSGRKASTITIIGDVFASRIPTAGQTNPVMPTPLPYPPQDPLNPYIPNQNAPYTTSKFSPTDDDPNILNEGAPPFSRIEDPTSNATTDPQPVCTEQDNPDNTLNVSNITTPKINPEPKADSPSPESPTRLPLSNAGMLAAGLVAGGVGAAAVARSVKAATSLVSDAENKLKAEEATRISHLFPLLPSSSTSPALVEMPLTESSLASELDEKMVAHILGGFMITDIKQLEGNSFSHTLSYLSKFIEALQNGNIDSGNITLPDAILKQLKGEFIQAKRYDAEITRLTAPLKLIKIDKKTSVSDSSTIKNLTQFHNPKEGTLSGALYSTSKDSVVEKDLVAEWEKEKSRLVEQVISDLGRLNPTETLLFPGGWKGWSAGHAMLYLFEKQQDGTFTLTITNTGSGLEAHSSMTVGTKDRYNPTRKFSHLRIVDGQIDKKLITSFIEKQMLSFTREAPSFSAQDIYGIEVERLAGYEAPSSRAEDDFITMQRSGTCSFNVLLAHARLRLGKEAYKMLHHVIQMNALKDGLAQLKNGKYSPILEPQIIAILRRSSQKRLKSVAKLMRQGILSPEEGRRTLTVVSRIIHEIDAYDRKHQVPFREEISSIFSSDKLSEELQQEAGTLRIYSGNRIGVMKPIVPLYRIPEKLSADAMLQVIPELAKQLKEGLKEPHFPDMLKDALRSIGYTANADVWIHIANDPVKRGVALNNLMPLMKFIEKSIANDDFTQLVHHPDILLEIHAMINLLSLNEWRATPTSLLSSFGTHSKPFEDILKANRLKDFFFPQYEATLNGVKSNNANRSKYLFEHPNREKRAIGISRESSEIEVINVAKKGEFEKDPDLCFFEHVLVQNAAFERSIILDDYQSKLIEKMPELGKDKTERERRFKAIRLLTQDLDTFENLPSALIAYKLSRDIEAITHQCNICEPVPRFEFITGKNLMTGQADDVPYILCPGALTKQASDHHYLELLPGAFRLDRNLFGQKVDHQLQNGILRKYAAIDNQKELPISRELNAVGSSIPVQVDRLLYFFDANSNLFYSPKYQAFFQARLLEGNILIDHLKGDPAATERLFAFISDQIRNFYTCVDINSAESVNAVLYLMQLHGRIHDYLLNAPDFVDREKLLEQCSRSEKEHLDIVRPLKTQIKDAAMQKLFYQTEIFCHPELRDLKKPLSFDAVKLIMTNLISLKKIAERHHMDTTVPGKKFINQRLNENVLELVFHRNRDIQKIFDDPSHREVIFYEITKLLGLENDGLSIIPTAESTFPTYELANKQGRELRINILTGSIWIDKREVYRYNRRAEHPSSSNIQKVLTVDKNTLEWKPFGTASYQTIYQGHRLRVMFPLLEELEMSHRSSEEQIILDQGQRQYVFYSEESLNNGRLYLPPALTKNTLVWVSPDRESPAMLIYNREMTKLLAEVDTSGNITLSMHPGMTVTDCALSPETHHIANFQRDQCLAWKKNDAIEILEYNFPENNLNFTRNEAGKLCWNDNPKFYIAASQSVPVLKGYSDYLLLENSKGKQKLILQGTVRTFDTTLNRRVINKPDYVVVSLSKKGELEPVDTLQNLYAARVLYEKGDYARAIHYLLQGRAGRPYTRQEMSCLELIMADRKKDPWAALVRIYAYSQGRDNLNAIPPSKQEHYSDSFGDWDMKEGVNFNKKIANTIVEDFTSYVENRNMPERYQPVRILGKLRTSRLLMTLPLSLGTQLSPRLKAYMSELHGASLTTPTVTGPSESFVYSTDIYKPDYARLYRALTESYSTGPSHLTRPGVEFQNKFRSYYSQASSPNKQEREALKEQLFFMRYETNWDVQQLMNLLFIVMDRADKGEPNNRCPTSFELQELKKAMRTGIDQSSEDMVIDQRLNHSSEEMVIDQWFNHTLSSRYPDRKYQKQRGILGTEHNNQAVFPSPPLPPLKHTARKKFRFLSQNIPEALFPEDIQKQTMMEAVKNPACSLCDKKRLDKLGKTLNLSQYVLNGIEELNRMVEDVPPTIEVPILMDNISLDSLENRLSKLVKESNVKNLELKDEIMELANKKSGNKERDLELELMCGGGAKEPRTLELLLKICLNDEWCDLQEEEPKLLDADIILLREKIITLMTANVQAQQAVRAIEKIKELNSSPLSQEEAKNLREELGAILTYTRPYNPFDNPAILLFEYATGWTVSATQAKAIQVFFEKDNEGDFRNVILQIIMGGGKSKVLSPIQAQMKADGHHLSFMVLPDALYETGCNDAQTFSRSFFNQSVKTFEFSRNDNTVPYLKNLLTMLNEAIVYREYLITRPKDLLSLELTLWETEDMLVKQQNAGLGKCLLSKDCQEIGQKLVLLRSIVSLIQERGNSTFDEADTIFHPKLQLHFTFGAPNAPPEETVATIADIYQMLHSNPELRDMLQLHQNRQHLAVADDKKWEQVRQTVLKAMVLREINKENCPLTTQEAETYCNGKDSEESRALYVRLNEMYSKADPQVRKAIQRLAVIKCELESNAPLLRETLSKNANTHYGISKENPQQGFAMPYRANNTPNEGSQLADLFETINKTLQTVSCTWKEPVQTMQLVHYLKERVITMRSMGNEDEIKILLENFQDMSGIGLYDPQILDPQILGEATAKIDQSLATQNSAAYAEILIDFAAKVPLKEQLKIFQGQFSATTQDLEGMMATSQGYTGTLGSQHSFAPRVECMPNVETDQKTIRTLIETKAPVRNVEGQDPSSVIKSLLDDRPDRNSFHAFIDIGFLFKGQSNRSVSKELLMYFLKDEKDPKSTIKTVLFWDDDLNTPHLLYQEGKKFKTLKLQGTSQKDLEKACKKINMTLDNLFTYYSERHIVGSDIFYKDGVRAFATVGTHTLKDKLLQGVMRMRKLNTRRHHVEFVCQKAELQRIAMTLKEGKLSDVDINDLILHAEIVQESQELQSNYDATIAMLQFQAKRMLKQKYLVKGQEASRWFRAIRPLIVHNDIFDAFLKHGAILTKENAGNALDRYAEQILGTIAERLKAEKIEDPSILNEMRTNMKAIIKRKMQEKCLPENVSNAATLGIEVQQQLEKDQKKEQRREVEREREVERDLNANKLKMEKKIESDWAEGDIFDPSYPLFDQTKTPTLQSIPLDDVLKKIRAEGIIDKRIYATTNFLYTLEGSNEPDLFNNLQKGLCEVLVVEENDQVKVLLLSAKEAAFFKKKLSVKTEGAKARKIWLVHPNGILIKGESSLWPSSHPDASLLLLQTLFFSGNITALTKKASDLERWIRGDNLNAIDIKRRKATLYDFLKRATSRSSIEERKLKNSVLNKLFEK